MRLLRTFLFLFVALCLGVPSQAQSNRLDDILSRGVLRVGTTGDYKPFSYRPAGSGDFIGLDVELAGQLAKALGVKLELVPTTWPSLMKVGPRSSSTRRTRAGVCSCASSAGLRQFSALPAFSSAPPKPIRRTRSLKP